LPNLNYLHLSGNSITNSLNYDIKPSPSLEVLTLSNNYLSNQIPDEFLKKQWNSLDLAFNKFNGLIESYDLDINSNLSLALQNNHLSGIVPIGLHNAKLINILVGNLFSCSLLDKEDILPINDPNLSVYVCGSNNFNLSLYVSSISIFLFLMFIKGYSYLNEDSSIIDNEKNNYNEEEINSSKNKNSLNQLSNSNNNLLHMLNENLNNYMKVFLRNNTNNKELIEPNHSYDNITLFCDLTINITLYFKYLIFVFIFVLLPICVFLSNNYGVYDQSYGWSMSAIFITGLKPGRILAIVLTISLITIYCLVKKEVLFTSNYQVIDKLKNNVDSESNKLEETNCNISKISTIFIVATINLVVMIIVNGFFVYATLNFNGGEVLLVEFFVAGEFINLNNSFYIYIIIIIIFIIIINIIFQIGIKAVWKDFILPLLINNIKKIIYRNKKTSNDFYDLNKNDIYFISSLTVLNLCGIPWIATGSINPSCLYRAFYPEPPVQSKYMYTLCTLFDDDDNCLQYGETYRYTSYTPPFMYSYLCASTLLTDYAPIYIFMSMLLVIGKPIAILFSEFLQYIAKDSLFYPIVLKLPSNRTNYSNQHIFNQRIFVVNLISFLSIILSYGLLMPIVGVFCTICLWLYIYYTMSQLSYIIENENDENNLIKLLDMINNDCNNMKESINSSINIIFIVFILSFGYIVFDCIGSDPQITVYDVIWYLFLFPSLYLTLLLIHAICNYFNSNIFNNKSKEITSLNKNNINESFKNESRNPVTLELSFLNPLQN
jgi:hypothetical protein